MAWNSADWPNHFRDSFSPEPTTSQHVEKKIEEMRAKNVPHLQEVLEHREWIDMMLSIFPGHLHVDISLMAGLLVRVAAQSNSKPEAFQRVHANFPLVAQIWKEIACDHFDDFKAMILENSFHDQFIAYFNTGDYRGIKWRRDGQYSSDETPLEYYPTLKEMEEQRKMYATKIFENYRQLQKIVRHYGEEIGQYWESRYVCTRGI